MYSVYTTVLNITMSSFLRMRYQRFQRRGLPHFTRQRRRCLVNDFWSRRCGSFSGAGGLCYCIGINLRCLRGILCLRCLRCLWGIRINLGLRCLRCLRCFRSLHGLLVCGGSFGCVYGIGADVCDAIGERRGLLRVWR
jgi:hypothetical protein